MYCFVFEVYGGFVWYQLLINVKSIYYLVNIWSISAGKIDPPQYNICFLETFVNFKLCEDQLVSEKREHMVPKNTLIAAEQSKLQEVLY